MPRKPSRRLRRKQPVSEDITDPKDVNYYLDDANRLHIPKLTVDAITKWL